MGKQYTSKNTRYSGYVVMPDYFDWPEIIAWDENVYEVQLLGEKYLLEQDPRSKNKIRLNILATQARGILPMVLEWHISGIPEKPETLPATPGEEAANFHHWLVGIINGIISGTENPDPFLSSE